MTLSRNNRLNNEIEHSKYLLASNHENWGWSTYAGQFRFTRRVSLLIDQIPKDKKILEIGCGLGLFSSAFAERGYSVTAIDISPYFIKENRERYKNLNINFLEADAHDLKFDNNSFDYVIGCSILHHLDLKNSLAEIYRVLRPNGKVYFSEPNMLNPQIFLQKNVPFLKKISGDSPDETAYTKWHVSKTLSENKFTNIQIVPFDFLHPSTPQFFISLINSLGGFLEKTPLIKEIAGSLLINATRL
jgi:ubiquinone/menaquinone biosynthesis C-methylase UbiE